MIKFTLTGETGKVHIGLGLTERNIELLKQGKPIAIDLEEMGFKAAILIMYGRTEADVMTELNPYIGKDTIIRHDH